MGSSTPTTRISDAIAASGYACDVKPKAKCGAARAKLATNFFAVASARPAARACSACSAVSRLTRSTSCACEAAKSPHGAALPQQRSDAADLLPSTMDHSNRKSGFSFRKRFQISKPLSL